MKRLLVTIGMMTLIPFFSAGAQSAGGLSGRVTNGTANAAVPPSMTVTIISLDGDGKELSRQQVQTSEGGQFSAENLPVAAKYLVATDYLGVTYSTVSTGPTVDLNIWETTGDDASISINSDTITLVKGEKDEIEVLQLFRVKNAGDRAYTGIQEDGTNEVLDFPAAAGAFDLSPGAGITPGGLQTSSAGFTSTDPILPGATEVNYLYKVRPGRSGLAFERSVLYPTDHIDLLLGPGLSVEDSQFKFVETKALGGKDYRRYRRGSTPAGADLQLLVSVSSPGASFGLVAGLASGLILLVAAAILVPKARERRAIAPPRTLPIPVIETRESLVQLIALLDEEHAAGRLEDDDYRSRRLELKEKLSALLEATAPRA